MVNCSNTIVKAIASVTRNKWYIDFPNTTITVVNATKSAVAIITVG
jgi:hypothetical protein